MCINIVGFGNDREEIREVLESVFIKYSKSNRDGFFVGDIKNHKITRTLDSKVALKEVKALNTTYAHMHLRYATAGLIDEKNIHGWKFGEYYVSHNGYYGYITSYLGDDNSDSYIMFSSLDYTSMDSLLNSINKLRNKIYGILFLTSRTNIVAVAVSKDMHIYKTRENVYFANVPLEISEIYYGGLEFDYPHTSINNEMLAFNIINNDLMLARKEKLSLHWRYYRRFGDELDVVYKDIDKDEDEYEYHLDSIDKKYRGDDYYDDY